MLKKPSPWPNWSDGLRIVQSRPDARDERLGLRLRARVVQAPGRRRRPSRPCGRAAGRRPSRIATTTSRVPSVLTSRRLRAAVAVARDGREVEDGIDAVEGRRAATPGRVTSPIRGSTRSRQAARAGGRGTSSAPASASARARRRDGRRASRAGTRPAADEAAAPVTRMVDMPVGSSWSCGRAATTRRPARPIGRARDRSIDR